MSGSVNVSGTITTATGQGFKITYGSGSYNIPVGGIGSFGSHICNTNTSFGYTFTSSPQVFITCKGSWDGYMNFLITEAQTITTTYFTLALTNPQSFTASGTYSFSWIAIGV